MLYINIKSKKMKAKNLMRIMAIVILMAFTLPAISSTVSTEPVPESTHTTVPDPRAQQLVNRLEEIKAMDKSTLTRKERKELKREVKSIKKEMKVMSGGVYLSIGAIIIIILLLILIL